MFSAGQCKITDHMQTVSASNSPAGDNTNYNFTHKTNQSLNIENIKPLDTVLSFVTAVSTHFLVTSRAKCIAAIFGRSFTGEKYHTNGRIFTGINQGLLELIQGFWPECVAN